MADGWASLTSSVGLAFEVSSNAAFVDLTVAYDIIMGSKYRTEASATGRSCEKESETPITLQVSSNTNIMPNKYRIIIISPLTELVVWVHRRMLESPLFQVSLVRT